MKADTWRGTISRALIATVPMVMLAVSCAESPTGPPPQRSIHRTVAVVVHDSLGTPASGATVRLVAEFDSAGIAPVVIGTTGAGGVVTAVLMQGEWGVHGLGSGNARHVAGAKFLVPGLSRPEADTMVVRLTLHTAVVARGRALLGPGPDHAGTVVGCPPAPPVFVTDATGAYELDLLPLGRWTITMYHQGFRLGLASLVITTPGDTMTVPDVQLTPE